jgi:hypothetical protein
MVKAHLPSKKSPEDGFLKKDAYLCINNFVNPFARGGIIFCLGPVPPSGSSQNFARETIFPQLQEFLQFLS